MSSIVTNSFQEFAPTSNARAVIFSGEQSTDSLGFTIASPNCLITLFQWVLLSKPEGAPDPLATVSGTLDSDIVITIPANEQGSFLYLLKITEGGVQSPEDFLSAPSSAFAVASVTTSTLGLHLMAEGERFHGDRTNENLLLIEAEVDQLRATVANAGDMPYATNQRLGSVKLNEAHFNGAVDESPDVVYTHGDTWKLLTEGGDATPLHIHPAYENPVGGGGSGTGGAYHYLRPDLLTGANDIIWSDVGLNNVIAVDGTNSDSTQTANFTASVDGNLLLDVGSSKMSSILLTDIDPNIGDFFVVIDMLVSPVSASAHHSSGSENAEAVNAYWEAMLVVEARDSSTGRYLDNAFDAGLISKPQGIAAVGMTLHNWTAKAMDFGVTPFNNTFNLDAGESIPLLTKTLPQGSLSGRVQLGVKRIGDGLRCFISVDDGGFYPTGLIVDTSTINNDKYSVYLSARAPQTNVGLRIETSAVRVVSNLDQYGLSPAFNPA
tara:strand:+ start:2936 stop:4414 length:1479 start_codon:yes stop_codon:yes gene_type:complete